MAKAKRKAEGQLPGKFWDQVEAVSIGKRLEELAGLLITGGSLVLIDVISVGMAIIIGYTIRVYILPFFSPVFPASMPAEFIQNLWWVVLIWLACLMQEKLYVRRASFWRETKRIVQASVAAFLFTMAIIALAKLGGELSRTTLVVAFIAGLVLLPAGRYLGKNLLAKIGLWNEPVLILGAGQTGTMIAHAFQSDPYMGYKVFGFLDDDQAKKKKGVIVNGIKYPILGDFDEAARLIVENGIKDVILAAPGMPGPELVSLTNRLKSYTHSFMVVPDLIGMSVAGGHMDYLADDRIVAYRTHNNLANPVNIVIKKIFDIAVGLTIFVCLIPVLTIIAIAIKLDSPGPVGFSHRRVGHNGKNFHCYKFRTMVGNAQVVLEDLLAKDPGLSEEWNRNFKLKQDPRVTRMGRFLRNTSLDELPQIFNVLKGDMSLVGPRPIVREEVAKFGQFIQEYYMVLPGMTGLWGVSGRSDTEYDDRVQLETWYVHNWSVWLDISLLFRTVPVILGRKGAY